MEEHPFDTELEELMAGADDVRDYVQQRIEPLLNGRVAVIRTQHLSWGEELGVAVQTHDGVRHAVVGSLKEAEDNPDAWIALVHKELTKWLDERPQ